MSLKIKLSNLNAKNKIILSVCLFLVICLILLYSIVLPNIKRIKYLQKSIINQKIEAEQNLIEQQNITQVNKKIQQIESQVDTLYSIFINTNKELEFITTLEGIASKNNITQTINLNFDAISTKQSYQEIPLNLDVKGTYNNLINYLIDLETLRYYINIHSFSITMLSSGQSPKDGGLVASPNYTMNLSANTYWK